MISDEQAFNKLVELADQMQDSPLKTCLSFVIGMYRLGGQKLVEVLAVRMYQWTKQVLGS